MKTQIIIDNLKCHGCANTIRRELSREAGVTAVEISHEDNMVCITHEGDEDRRAHYVGILKRLGYPEKGTGKTVDNLRSYVSCAIGRINH